MVARGSQRYLVMLHSVTAYTVTISQLYPSSLWEVP